MPHLKSKQYIIIGGGPSGLFAARELLKQGVDPKNIRILEKEPRIGGKCLTYSDALNPAIKTEVGTCIVLSNFRNIFSVIKEKNIATQKLLPGSSEGIPIRHALDTKTISPFKLAAQLRIYFKHLSRYRSEQYLSNASKDFFELSFNEYAKKHNMPDIPIFFKHYVSGFGYGPMEVIPAHAIFTYLERSVVFEIIASKIGNPIVHIKEGFQYLMERIAEDLM